jgi:ribosomal protein L33
MKSIVETKPTWLRGGIALVCEKCTQQRYVEDFPDAAGDERLNVKRYLKDRLKAEGRWGPIRVVGSSCLDVCARGGVTVLLAGIEDSTAEPRCIVVDPLEGREILYDAVVAGLTPRGAPARTQS